MFPYAERGKNRTQEPVDGRDNNRCVTVVVIYSNGNFRILNKKKKNTRNGRRLRDARLLGEWRWGGSRYTTDIYDYIEKKKNNNLYSIVIGHSYATTKRRPGQSTRTASCPDRKSCAALGVRKQVGGFYSHNTFGRDTWARHVAS